MLYDQYEAWDMLDSGRERNFWEACMQDTFCRHFSRIVIRRQT